MPVIGADIHCCTGNPETPAAVSTGKVTTMVPKVKMSQRCASY